MGNINITTPGIQTLLQNLNIHKASGPDRSLHTGDVPYDWRIANVTPIYKKGERCDPQNYRPISLTSICCKILEHIISSHLMKHLENNNLLLYEYQHGFRHDRSCETQLASISFINDLAKSYDNDKQTDVILMDIAKAFDTVPHNRLRHKLQWYGIIGNIFNSCNIGMSALPDSYVRTMPEGALAPEGECVHIRQCTSAYVTTVM